MTASFEQSELKAEEEPQSNSGPRAVIALALEAPESWPLPEEELRAVIERAAAAALAVAAADGATVEKDGVPPLIDVSLVDDETMRAVNAEWRGKDKPTNVLSFPAGEMPFVPDAPWPLGSLMLAGGVLQREAAARGVPLADHLSCCNKGGTIAIHEGKGLYHHENLAVDARIEVTAIAVGRLGKHPQVFLGDIYYLQPYSVLLEGLGLVSLAFFFIP